MAFTFSTTSGGSRSIQRRRPPSSPPLLLASFAGAPAELALGGLVLADPTADPTTELLELLELLEPFEPDVLGEGKGKGDADESLFT